ncbi:MAG: general secretion pathway protein GspK [Polymorphobacter sp.]
MAAPAGQDLDSFAVPARDEEGYAILAAVVAIAVLALMALAFIDSGRGLSAGVVAEAEHAHLAAASDAALAIAVRNLAEPDRTRRWSIDGRPHNLHFAGSDVLVTVEDERGKVPLNQLTDEQVRTLFETLGASGVTLETCTDAFLDWLDEDDERRPEGAETADYRELGYRPRNGAVRSVEELMLVRGMPAGIVQRLRSVATPYTNPREGFDERFASPLALAVISGGGPGSTAVINRERELAGQRVAIELAEGDVLAGRPLTIRVEARRPGGSVLRRATVIALTGFADNPFVVRAREP